MLPGTGAALPIARRIGYERNAEQEIDSHAPQGDRPEGGSNQVGGEKEVLRLFRRNR